MTGEADGTGTARTDRPVAVVTGGARGIGAAVARALAAAGHAVVVVDRCADDPALPYPLATEADLAAAVDACAAAAVPAVGLVADVRDQAALDAVVAGTMEQFGRLDVAVAAAGAVAGGPPAWETSDATWTAMVGVNLEGVWRLARAAVPAMLASPPPHHDRRFVAVASAAGTEGLPQLAAYTAAKHGVIGLVKALAKELAPHRITANAVCPGSTRTAMLEASAAVYGLAGAETFAAQQPLGRLLDPAEVAAAVVFLCSPAAAGITGAALPVDAGMTA